MRNAVALAMLPLLCLGIGVAGGLLTLDSVGSWYAELEKPARTPPGWVFGPVWTVLYVAMAVSAWLVWNETGLKAGAVPLGLRALQLPLDAAWTRVFFGLKLPGAAFSLIVALLLTVLPTTVTFLRVSRPAALLMLPYLAWVTFASALNFTIWWLNA